jgi:hypothetical protein
MMPPWDFDLLGAPGVFAQPEGLETAGPAKRKLSPPVDVCQEIVHIKENPN